MNKNRCSLEVISDPKLLDIFERSKRGGLTFVGGRRYGKVNNQHIAGYDQQRMATYSLYFDADNLYGLVMVQASPYKDIMFSNATTLEPKTAQQRGTW